MTTSPSVERRRCIRARALLILSTALCSGLAAPAYADAPYKNLDGNGVDLTDGSFNLNLLEGSIGSGQSAMQLIRLDATTTNWTAPYLTQTISGSTYTISVVQGTITDTFTGTISGGTGTLVSTRATGALLQVNLGGNYVYRYHEGSTLTFGNPTEPPGGTSNICDGVNQNGCRLYALEADGRAGLSVTYNYDVHRNCSDFDPDGNQNCIFSLRLNKVNNSAGYAIEFAFISNSEGGIHANPPSTWFQIASAKFTNANVTATSWPTVTYAYPSSLVTTITTPGGRVWRITNDSSGRVTAVKRPSSSTDTTTVSYNTGGVSSVTNNGITTGYSRTVSGATATTVVTDALAKTTTVISDMTKYRPTKVTDPLMQVTQIAYDSVGRPTDVTYPELNITHWDYDSRGNVTAITNKAKPGSGLSDIVTTANFDTTCTNFVTCNSPHWTKDALGNVTDYTYDPTNGSTLTVTSPAATAGAKRPQTRYSYSTVSGVSVLTGVSACATGDTSGTTCVGTSDETKTTIAYNTNLLPTSVTTAAGDNSISATTAASYDAIGNVLTVDGPLSGAADTTTYRYDADRLRLGAISPDPDGAGSLKRRAVKTTYNSDGQATVIELGTVNGTTDTDWAAFVSVQQSTATYDTNSFKTKDVLTAASTTYGVTQYSYDALGRLQCSAVRMNSSIWGSLPSSACTLGTTGPDGPDRIIKASFDDAGQQTKMQTAFGVTGVQSDDATATYSSNGKTATLTDAEGNKTTYEYDGFDRLLKTRYPNTTKGSGTSSTTDYEQLSYDADSRVTSRRLRDGNSIGYGYDYLSRLVSKDLPGSELDVGYSYDLLSRLAGTSTSTQSLSFTYDALNRNLTQVGPQGTVSSAYDAAGRRTQLTYPGGSFYVTYGYLVTGEMTSIKESGSTSLATFGYDDLGRRTTLTRGNGVVTSYGYDNVSRLASQGIDAAGTGDDLTLGFGYNAGGQIASATRSNDAYAWNGAANVNRTYTANGLNQYSAAGSTSFSYDPRGNLTASGSNSYTYSSENLLLTGPNSASLVYDPLLRLYQTSATGFSTTRFAYDGANVIGEYSSSNTLQKRYVFGPGTDEPLVEYDNSGIKTFLVADERGSVVGRTNSSGTVTTKNSYDEYGIPGSANAGRFQYTGQAWLSEIGMAYYKARIYSPNLGRFMQTDTIGYNDGPNWYNYVGGDPLNRRDPTGTTCSVDKISWDWFDGTTGKDLGFAFFTYKTAGCEGGFLITSYNSGPSGGGGGRDQGDVSSATFVQDPCRRQSSLDPTINSDVDKYNMARGLSSGNAEYLDATLVEAMVTVESGYNASAYKSDPMQVNNPGDWVPEKGSVAGLTKGIAPGQSLGIQAGIAWLTYKAYSRSAWNAPLTFRGWNSAVTRYNGGGDPNYLSKVQAAQSAIIMQAVIKATTFGLGGC